VNEVAVPASDAVASVVHLHHEETVMGTVVTLDVYGGSGLTSGSFEPYLKQALASLHESDRIFSLWKSDSLMSRYRRQEINLETACELVEVLEACEAARDLSEGWFDPWALPGGVDPTGYVKGWAAQRALNELLGAPLHGAIVNAAGDIASFGFPAPGAMFEIGIVNPSTPNEMAATATLVGCVATSGVYERGQHLIDPFSGARCSRLASASVMGPDLGLADALATALAVAGADFLAVIEELSEFEAFAISFEEARHWTSRFPLTSLAASA